MVECAFKSQHPTVLEWMHEANRMQREWGTAMSNLRSRYPDYQVMVRKSTLSTRLVGLAGSGPPDDEGWRFEKREAVWVPDKRTTRGKALTVEVFESSELELPPLPGMPVTTVDGNKWYHPGVTQYDGVVWVSWGCEADTVRGSGWSRSSFDDDLWTEAPLSEFYLAKEGADV